jgi:hypothetical protein
MAEVASGAPFDPDYSPAVTTNRASAKSKRYLEFDDQGEED